MVGSVPSFFKEKRRNRRKNLSAAGGSSAGGTEKLDTNRGSAFIEPIPSYCIIQKLFSSFNFLDILVILGSLSIVGVKNPK